MAETFSTPFGDIDPAAVEAATAAAAQADSRRNMEEITIKFAKGLCSGPFTSKEGKEFVRIQIPNSDQADHDPWQEFVMESKQVHENQYGKGLWAKIPADIEIYVDRIASMQIDTLNATVDAARQEVINKYHPNEPDINMKTLEAAHIDETEYFFHRIADDLQPIISDIRDAHKNDDDTDPVNTRAAEIQKELQEAAEFPGSDKERQARCFLMQLGINYDSLYPDEFVTFVNVLKKSKMLSSHLSKRGRNGTRKKRR